MITEDKVIEIFYMADEYSKEFSKVKHKYSLGEGCSDGRRHRNKPNRMSDAEIMVILILFHTGGFRCFKHFYLGYVCRHMRHLFPRVVSYSRFVILPLLPSVHLDKEYVLSSFRYGVENFGYEYIPYIHQNSAVKEWYPPEDLNYNGIRAFPKGISPRGLILRITSVR